MQRSVAEEYHRVWVWDAHPNIPTIQCITCLKMISQHVGSCISSDTGAHYANSRPFSSMLLRSLQASQCRRWRSSGGSQCRSWYTMTLWESMIYDAYMMHIWCIYECVWVPHLGTVKQFVERPLVRRVKPWKQPSLRAQCEEVVVGRKLWDRWLSTVYFNNFVDNSDH